MEFKKSIIIMILIVFLAGIAGVCASDVNDTAIACEDSSQLEISPDNEMTEDNLQAGDDETVTSETEAQTLTAGEGTYSDLRADINNGGNLTKRYYLYHEGDGETIKITPLNKFINGNGAVIDMAGSDMQAFFAGAPGATFKNLTIKNARYLTNGAAIYFTSSGTIENCNFTNCTASSNGGALYFNGAGTVTNCNFANTTSSRNGGAIYFSNRGTVTNCSFTSSNATDNGGAIYFNGNGKMTDCNFVNTTVSRYAGCGGAAYFNRNGTVENCNFTGAAAYFGAAIYFHENSTGKLMNCNFTGATTCYGGAIYFYKNATGELMNCNFTDNNAKDIGGAICFFIKCKGTITNCSFADNKAGGGGGAVCFWNNGDGTVTNCNFTTQSSNEGGALCFLGSCKGTIANCNFADNNARTTGGAICFLNDCKGTITNCNFTNNQVNDGDGGAVHFYGGSNVANCNFADNKAGGCGGGVSFNAGGGNVMNCSFTNNQAPMGLGGAVYFSGYGEVTNCNFTGATADCGGAVYFRGSGTVESCNFINNTASSEGGAIGFYGGTVTNCNFTGNTATAGSAIFKYDSFSNALAISDSTFLNNRADADDITPLMITPNENNIEIVFIGQNNLINAIYSYADGDFTNVTYWGAEGIENTGNATVRLPRSIMEAGQNITVGVVVDDRLVLNELRTTDENGTVVLDISVGANYCIHVRHEADSYYTAAEQTLPHMKFHVDVTEMTATDRTVNITAKSNIYREAAPGRMAFILPDGTEINATYASDGIWWAIHTFDEYKAYQINASYAGLDSVAISNATITVNKARTQIGANAITATYNSNRNLVISLKDENGKAVTGAKLTVSLNGIKTYVTDRNGQIKVPTKGLVPKSYVARISFKGDADHVESSKDVKVTVKKAKAKLTAKKKTFKKSKKVKKYTVTLKDTAKKPIRKAKLTLKIKGKKAITVKTNKKGKATFKIKKLTKKGKYTTKVTFKGNNCYAKLTKKVKIILK